MSNIAILGHPTRGREVIQLLEMLGGVNKYSAQGNCPEILYFICDNKGIKYLMKSDARTDLMKVYTLKEFKEKFPYKVGDKVYNIIHNENQTITEVAWDFQENVVVYQTNNNEYLFVNYLQPYKEEIMEERKYADLRLDVDQNDKLATEVTIDGNKIIPPKNYLIGKITKVDNGMLIEFVKKQPQYPKDYVECCRVLGYSGNYNMILTTDIDCKLFNAFYRLKVCRDAYWKLAGKEMGLDKPWKPDWDNLSTTHEFIKINKGCFTYSSRVLVFPTEEMRDAFFENFKDLINECKELL